MESVEERMRYLERCRNLVLCDERIKS